MPDILNEDGSCTDIKTITTRSGKEVEYSKSSIINNINALVSPMSGGKSFASVIMAQQRAITAAMKIPIQCTSAQMSAMSVVQSRGRTVRANNEPVYRYTVSANYPYSVSVKDNDKDSAMVWFDYYAYRDTHYVTRMEAEKGSLVLLVNHHKKQLHRFKVDASKYSRKKNKKAFSGYHLPNSSKYQRAKKMSDNAAIRLETIEEEHPEWLI